MEFQRICTVDGQGRPINKGTFIPYGVNPHKYVTDKTKPYYLSTAIYSEEQKAKYEATNSIAGMDDVVTDRIYFDFDSKDNLDKAKADAQEMCARLIQHGIAQEDILLCFSGAKGFSVEVKSDKRLKPEEVKLIASKMAEGLETFDGKIYDAARIFRVPYTRHQDTGLYKFPLSFDELNANTIDDIKFAASEEVTNEEWLKKKVVELPESILELKRRDTKDRAITATIVDAVDLDFKHKPKGFSNCKFAIMNGFFPEGSRNHSMMILASTCRANGFPQEIAYNIAKASIRLQAQRHGSDPFPKEELWTQVIQHTYGPRWNGGQYTCKTDPTLKKICESLGAHKCKQELESSIVESDEVFSLFKTYAIDYEKNVLTTGIGPIDNKIKLLMGTSNGILAAPGAGKTSLSLSILNHNSNQGVNSLFCSFDMFHAMLYMRICQRHFGLQQEEIFKIIREDPKKTAEIRELIKAEYKNVNFCFKAGQTPEQIKEMIIATEQKTGNKTKLVVIDYSELVISESSDPTQASAEVAQKLRTIANEQEVCVVTLLQPSKLYSNPSEEILSHQGAKGSSAIAQSLTTMISLSRPGFNPRKPEEDRFITANVVKNRNGPLFSIDMGWDGIRGKMYELGYDEEQLLKEIRQRKESEKASEDSW